MHEGMVRCGVYPVYHSGLRNRRVHFSSFVCASLDMGREGGEGDSPKHRDSLVVSSILFEVKCISLVTWTP